ncbi:MAG: RluA family pseudouridine synthase [Gammaproteobacteria bacterium]|nr:RluA family pseudouridine synthase [Gammaproteobacteria bacterium]NIR85702.1 RluA family pseudouridine synthase [Gammaproteobacteria bacterium]NIR90235.1 RluA family pseudouridine synthase [Gammaproteobacteria bacterium]NIU06836.1 RluA family pseudouridine synthase [Gammaproteobacteria bacterium]NIV53769.1 RluA family pseudouridine synthase [Gammaproteobacteria bacterium]
MNPGTDTARQPASYLTVDEDHAGQRIDNFLATRLRGVPRARVYRILRRGEVRVNKRRIRQDYRLQQGDVVRLPPLRLSAPRTGAPAPAAMGRVVAASVLHEDHNLVVLNKPGGLPVHGGTGRSHGLIEVLRTLRPQAPFLELVHRLDRETSGCLLVAKRRSALRALHESLRARRVEKGYLLLVRGRWKGPERRVELPLRKNVLRGGERMVTLDPAGKTALTELAPVAVGDTASLLAARTRTGRTHQIRVHAAAAGYPLAGDGKYGDRAFNRAMKARGLRRLFLHADEVAFPDPGCGTTVRVEAPLPDDLRPVLEDLGLYPRQPAVSQGVR